MVLVWWQQAKTCLVLYFSAEKGVGARTTADELYLLEDFTRHCMPPRVYTWQVIEAFGKQQDPREVSERLVQAAKEAGSGDDITVVVAKLG